MMLSVIAVKAIIMMVAVGIGLAVFAIKATKTAYDELSKAYEEHKKDK